MRCMLRITFASAICARSLSFWRNAVTSSPIVIRPFNSRMWIPSRSLGSISRLIMISDVASCLTDSIPVLQLQFPSLAENGLDVTIRLGAIGEAQILTIPIEPARHAHRDGGQREPLRVGRCNADIRTGRIAALARADPVQHRSGRP